MRTASGPDLPTQANPLYYLAHGQRQILRSRLSSDESAPHGNIERSAGLALYAIRRNADRLDTPQGIGSRGMLPDPRPETVSPSQEPAAVPHPLRRLALPCLG